MPRGNVNNLIKNSDLTPEQLKKMTSNGGKKSGKVRHEKKLMSQIMAEFLMREHDVTIDKKKIVKMSGSEQVNYTMAKVLNKTDSSSVSLMKAIADVTEGSKVKIQGDVTISRLKTMTDDELNKIIDG